MSVLLDFLKRVQPEHHDIIQDLDSSIRKAAPDLVVSLKWKTRLITTNGMPAHFLNHPDFVNLQVWGGAEFEDPTGLLQGTGKGMRHIKFVAGAKFNHSAVEAIIKQAAKVARA
jgi:hypothetical protein